MPTGHYGLPIELAVTNCSDSIPPESLFTARVPFLVDSCETPPPGCLIGTWEHPGGPGLCDAFIALGQQAQVTLSVITTVPLWGLQGTIVLSPPDLDIVRLEAVGEANALHLSWTRTSEGARFVMFASDGPPIAGSGPVLRVTTTLVRRIPVPPTTLVFATQLLGADAIGNAVPECPFRTDSAIRVAPARICAQKSCDHNDDGAVDVRDLVVAVRCLRTNCPDFGDYDSDGDLGFDLDDVICCARRILGAPPCNDCPPDSIRHEPSVRLAFGTPASDADGISLPLRLEKASRVGAARFALRFPADRYDVAGVEFPGVAPGWLTLYETQEGQVVVALVKISDSDPDGGEEPVNLVLRLALRPDRAPGGEVSCAESEFSGPDGVPLEITIERASVPLGGPLRMALSENRPNPFASTTRFSLTLSTAAPVDVGVYDVTGRLVASLHRGPLDAGVHELVWNGRAGEGGPVPSGIYFARAASGAFTVSRRMVVLRGN
jgi:hypothetical protein